MASTATDDSGLITLGEIVGAIRRQWRIVAGFAAVGVLAAAAMVLTSPASYTATSELVIDPITTDPFAANSRPVDAVNPITERSVLLGSSVAEAVISRLKLDTTPSDLLSRVEAVNPDGSLTLVVTATASTDKKAQALADGFSQTYLDQRSAMADKSIAGVVQNIDAELAKTQEELAAAIASGVGLVPTSFQAQQVEAQVSTLRTRVATLEERRTQLVSASTTPGRITLKADLPTSPSGLPSTVLGLGVFMVFTSIGLVAAVIYDRRGGRLRDLSGIQAVTHGATVDIALDSESVLEESISTAALDMVSNAATTSSALLCSITRTAPTLAADRLVLSLVASGRKVLVVWTGERADLPEKRVKWPVLEQMCSGDLDTLSEDERTDLWVVPDTGVGSAALARDDAAVAIHKWATTSGFGALLVVSPSPQFQPAVAGFARYVEYVMLTSVGQPRRSQLAGAVAALTRNGVGVDRVLVTPSEDDAQ